MPVHQQHKSLSESASLGSHFRENLQQTHFSVVLPVSGLISLQQSLIERNKLNFMMKQEAVEALLIICILKLQQEIVGWQ